MSVTADIEIRYRLVPYRSIDLPDAVWYAQGAVIGDATGGHMELNILLNATGQRTGRSWSLEDFLPTVNVSLGSEGVCSVRNMDQYGPGQANPVTKSFRFTIGGNTALSAPEAAIQVRDIHPRFFLGNQAASSTPAQLRLRLPNIDANTFGVYASGYVWPSSASLIGARRPVDGMLG